MLCRGYAGVTKIKNTHLHIHGESKEDGVSKTTHPLWKHHPPHPLGGVWQSLKAGLGVWAVSDSVCCIRKLPIGYTQWWRAHVVSMQRYPRGTYTNNTELRVDVVMTTRVLFVEGYEPATRRYHLWHNLVKQNHCPAIGCVMLCNMRAVIGFQRECWLTAESCPTKYIGLLLLTAKPTIT